MTGYSLQKSRAHRGRRRELHRPEGEVDALAAPPVAQHRAERDGVVLNRPGVRRGRAGEQGTADVFASIFGGDAAPAATSSSAAEPSVQPSPSEGSDDGKQRGRVRRARDGR